MEEVMICKKGTSYVISAPSGAGKTTLCNMIIKNVPGFRISVSYTTRSPREGEMNDVHYTFIKEDEFKSMIEKGEFAEWAVVHGNLYGTSIKRLKELNADGYDIILDIDTRGAMQLKEKYENAVYIFILPPSMEVLKERLIRRKTDAEEVVKHRLENARDEIKKYREYDFVIFNENLEKAYHELESIMIARKLRTENIDHEKVSNLFE